MLPSIYKRNQRPINALLAGAAGIAVLAGCTSQGESQSSASTSAEPTSTTVTETSPTPTLASIEVGCQPEQPDKWTKIPSNFNLQRFAQILGVSVTELATYGRFGGATCQQPVSVDRIPTDNPPIVSVSDEGGPCVVMGTLEDPRTITQTAGVLAVCVGSK